MLYRTVSGLYYSNPCLWITNRSLQDVVGRKELECEDETGTFLGGTDETKLSGRLRAQLDREKPR